MILVKAFVTVQQRVSYFFETQSPGLCFTCIVPPCASR